MKQQIYDLLINQAGALTLETVLLNFAAAAAISVLIFISYRISFSGPVYSRKFNISLVMLTLITTLVMNVIGNNISLSLGMVGALSIVRFRTAIKDPRDTAYIFWCIAVGICCGVSDYMVAAIGSVVLFAFLAIFGVIHDAECVMVVIRMDTGVTDVVHERMNDLFSGKQVLKMQNTSKDGVTEIIYQVSGKKLNAVEKQNGKLAPLLSQMDGVRSASAVMQDTEITQ
ncbi:MAG: DUF4956 domain-containing protein [Lachnospiraceae bacterium]|nr:DUF4956 domain-containing protein [Lachnospiraceae bacterium]